MDSDDRRWALGWISFVVLVAGVSWLLLLRPWHRAGGSTGEITAVVGFVGVLVTAAVSLIGLTVTRQSNRRLSQEANDEQRRLRLDAAMRAGALFSSTGSEPVDPASIASSLLALTKLDHGELAAALLVDFWSDGKEKVSTETAVLVIDAALRSKTQPNAQLVAAEILCRNASRLDSCHSLNWPSAIDGCWDRAFGPKTKFLLLKALVNMTLSREVNESALRSVAVRLYGIWSGDPDKRIQGLRRETDQCANPEAGRTRVYRLRPGESEGHAWGLARSGGKCDRESRWFLDRIVEDQYKKLQNWAGPCTRRSLGLQANALATAAYT